MGRMTKKEIQELLDLKGWSKRRLASELGLSEDAVYCWFLKTSPSSPGGPATKLMRHWLVEARQSKSMPAASA
jgi:DNA-binding transcriptional regulator YiaG